MKDRGSAKTPNLVGKAKIDDLDRTAQNGAVKSQVGNGEYLGNFLA